MALRERRARRVDLANLTINATQLAAIVAFIWGVATMYQKLIDRIGDMQSQIGETNARLDKMAQP